MIDMTNRVKHEMEKIEIPKELSERSRRGVSKAGKEMKGSRKFSLTGIGIAAALFLSFGAFLLLGDMYLNDVGEGRQAFIGNKGDGITIPAIKLPKKNTADMDMIGLIVYNGKIYTQTNSQVKPEVAKTLIGEKLGVTKGNIDEWSSQKAYAEELASTTVRGDVYTVKGYEPDFRIMMYSEGEGGIWTGFYENLNGITINSGADLFGKLKMTDRVTSAHWRTHDEWYNDINDFKPVTDAAVLNAFLEELDHAKPILRERNGSVVDDLRNDGGSMELTVNLQDGSSVRLELLQGGYIVYGAMDVYFKMDEAVFSNLWSQFASN